MSVFSKIFQESILPYNSISLFVNIKSSYLNVNFPLKTTSGNGVLEEEPGSYIIKYLHS